MQDGTDSEEGIRYYEERAKGGAGLIMTGAMFLSEKTAQGGPTLNLYSTRAIPKATVMVERVHRWGAKMCLRYHVVPDVRYAGYRRACSDFLITEPFVL